MDVEAKPNPRGTDGIPSQPTAPLDYFAQRLGEIATSA